MSSYKVVTVQGRVEVVEANSPLAAVEKYASTVLGLSIKAIRLTTEEAMNSGWKFRAELLENGAKAKKSYYWTESREEYENERQAAGNRGGQGAVGQGAVGHEVSAIGKSKRKATNEVYISAKKKRQQARKQLENNLNIGNKGVDISSRAKDLLDKFEKGGGKVITDAETDELLNRQGVRGLALDGKTILLSSLCCNKDIYRQLLTAKYLAKSSNKDEQNIRTINMIVIKTLLEYPEKYELTASNITALKEEYNAFIKNGSSVYGVIAKKCFGSDTLVVTDRNCAGLKVGDFVMSKDGGHKIKSIAGYGQNMTLLLEGTFKDKEFYI